MRYLAVVPFLFLPGCRLFDSAFWSSTDASGATPVDVVTNAGPAIIQQAASGNYVGALVGAGSVIATLMGWKGYQRVKASGPGTLGILAKKEEG